MFIMKNGWKYTKMVIGSDMIPNKLWKLHNLNQRKPKRYHNFLLHHQ